MLPEVLTGREAAKYLRISERTLRRYATTGRVPCWLDEDTGRRRYPKAALDAFLVSFADRKAS